MVVNNQGSTSRLLLFLKYIRFPKLYLQHLAIAYVVMIIFLMQHPDVVVQYFFDNPNNDLIFRKLHFYKLKLNENFSAGCITVSG